MSELPKGWSFCSLFDVTKPKQWKTIPTKELLEEGYPLYGANGIIGKYSSYTHEESTIMITCRGASCGNIHISQPKSYINGNAMALDNLSKHIYIKYLYYFLRSANFSKVISGTAQPQITQEGLHNLTLLIAPLNEQNRIADKLDSMLAKVDAAQTRLDKIPNILKRFRQSVLAAATSGELTKEWRGDSVEPEITDKYSAPKSWDLFIFEKLVDVVTSGSRGWAKYYSDQGSTFIRAQNINSDSLNLSDIAYVTLPEKAEGRRTKVEKDNLLITITGANVTKAARVEIELTDAYVSQHVALVKLKNNELSPFIELFIKAENSGRGQLLGLAYGAGKPGLNLQNIKGLEIALPPVEEQKEIVRRVESLFTTADTIEKQYKDAKARTNRLTQSILAKAFRGELVSQDPNDEPASELLARIKANLDNVTAKPKVKRKTKAA